jgi:hypothetical protein
LFFLFLLRITIAAKVNRTIDDTYGDPATGIMPTYLPQTGSWANASCGGCMIKADPNVAYDGSWTAATYHSGGSVAIELPFTGRPFSYFCERRLMSISNNRYRYLCVFYSSQYLCRRCYDSSGVQLHTRRPTSRELFSSSRLEHLFHLQRSRFLANQLGERWPYA